jgi:hypothetical protein
MKDSQAFFLGGCILAATHEFIAIFVLLAATLLFALDK